MKEVTLSAMWTDELGELIKQRSQDAFPFTTVGDEARAVEQAWNIGIDPSLEAFTKSTAEWDGHRLHVNLHPSEFHIMVRRLLELEAAEGLAYSLCSSLGIDLV